MTTTTTTTTTTTIADQYAAQVSTLSDAIAEQANGSKRLAAAVRAIAADYIGKPDQLAELLTVTRFQVFSRRDKAVSSLKKQNDFAGADVLAKSYINAIAYAVKCAGDVADCTFPWDSKRKAYNVGDKKAAGEKPQATAAGKDANSAEQSAALVDAAEKAPVMVAADRQGHLMGILSSLLGAGYTLAEIEAAWHGMAGKVARDEKAAEVAASATTPQAPVLLEKLEKLENKPRQAERGAKRDAA